MSRLANRCIADLDNALGRTGELVKLGRLSDAPEGTQGIFYCENVPAMVVLSQPQETIAVGALGSIQDSIVIISPTRMIARQWPAPPRKDDRIWITMADGTQLTCNIESVVEHRVEGVVVRYEMKVRS